MIHCKNLTSHTKHYKLTQTMVSCGTLEVSMHLKRLRGGNGGDTRNGTCIFRQLELILL